VLVNRREFDMASIGTPASFAFFAKVGFMSFRGNLTPVASPVVAVCLPKRILSQNNAKKYEWTKNAL
jgi:hypothetical protein